MRGGLGRVLLVLVTVATLGLASVVPAFAQGLVDEKDAAKAFCEAIKEAAQEGTEEEKEAAELAKEACDKAVEATFD